MKKICALLTILLLPTILLADIAAWISKADAEKTAVFLKKQKEIKNYCAPCEDKTAITEAVKDVAAAPVKGEANYWEVSVNGEAKDIADIYYKTEQGQWRNVAIAVGVTVEGMDIKNEVPEFIPNEVLKMREDDSNDNHAVAIDLGGNSNSTQQTNTNDAESSTAGQKLQGRYKSSRGMLYYTFQTDGTFVKATAGGTADSVYGTQRPGTYSIQGNTITLKFSDGAVDQFSFEIDNENLKINGVTFWVWNN